VALAIRRSGIFAMLARARRYGAGPPEAGGAHVDHFATPRGGAPIDIRPELTDATDARRSGDARAPGVESNRATGFSGKLDVGEPFEQDPNRDLTMEATSPTSRSNGTSRPKALTATTQLIDATDRAHSADTRQRNQRPTVQKESSVSTGLGVSGRSDAISSIARSSAGQPMDG
jgi:hypothetical protein